MYKRQIRSTRFGTLSQLTDGLDFIQIDGIAAGRHVEFHADVADIGIFRIIEIRIGEFIHRSIPSEIDVFSVRRTNSTQGCKIDPVDPVGRSKNGEVLWNRLLISCLLYTSRGV